MIDKAYAGQINRFLVDLQFENVYLKNNITRVLIEGATLKQDYIIEILKCLIVQEDDNEKPYSSVRNISLGNIELSIDLINFIVDHMMN